MLISVFVELAVQLTLVVRMTAAAFGWLVGLVLDELGVRLEPPSYLGAPTQQGLAKSE